MRYRNCVTWYSFRLGKSEALAERAVLVVAETTITSTVRKTHDTVHGIVSSEAEQHCEAEYAAQETDCTAGGPIPATHV
jgi:hypothetical protein